MALTNFSLLTEEQKTIWSMDLWKQARNYSFVNRFLGKDTNSIIQHVTELKKSVKGARAVITLLAITGLSHRQAYGGIFAITLIKSLAVLFVIAVFYLTGIV